MSRIKKESDAPFQASCLSMFPLLMGYLRLRYIIGRSLRILLLLLCWYVSCYFLMMDWRVLPFDPVLEKWTGESCYYMAPNVRVPGDLSVYAGSTCWANSFFYPLDLLLYGIKHTLGIQNFSNDLTFSTLWLFLSVNLLLPFCSFIFRDTQSLRKTGVQVLLMITAVGWYFGLLILYHLIRQEMINAFLGQSLAVLGTTVALGSMYWIIRNKSYIFVVPLAISMLCGTIWLIVSLPLAEPYM